MLSKRFIATEIDRRIVLPVPSGTYRPLTVTLTKYSLTSQTFISLDLLQK